MSLKEYKPGTAFNGVIGRTFDVSEPAWPEPNRAREDAPNVLFIVLDDTGFGQLARKWDHLGKVQFPVLGAQPGLNRLREIGGRELGIRVTSFQTIFFHGCFPGLLSRQDRRVVQISIGDQIGDGNRLSQPGVDL